MVPFIHIWRKVIAKRMIPTWQFLPKILHILLFTLQAYRVILYTEPQIKRFVILLPFGQWVFDKSRVQKNRGAFFMQNPS